MAIKLTIPDNTFVPDVKFNVDGELVKNRDLPLEDQVSCEIKLANITEKSQYISFYTVKEKEITEFHHAKCVKKHVVSVKGLEEYKITDGKTLVNFQTSPEINNIIQQCFFKINGIHEDDKVAGSDGGEMTEGE